MAASAASKTASARSTQSRKSKAATLDMLKGKHRAVSTFSIFLPDEKGDPQEFQLTYKAIGAMEYDKLVGKYPPTTEQRADGQTFNINDFAPALISAVCQDPELSFDDAKEIWDSPDWSRGEVVTLWRRALDLCNRGFDIPFTVSG